MPAPKDLITLSGINYKTLQDGTWQYQNPVPIWETMSEPPTTGDLANLGINHVRNCQIPNASEGQVWKVRGEFSPSTGTWVIKVRVGKNIEASTRFEFPLGNGSFEFEVGPEYLGVDDFTWVWVSNYSHTPMNPEGIWVSSALRVTTG